MNELFPVGCVIMASGLSRRFGSNKLLADFCGEPILCHAFAAADTPQLAARIVVTRSEEVRSLCEKHSIPVLLHSLPGRNDTVRLGLSCLLEQRPDLAGCMFLPGDQPLLTRKSVEGGTTGRGWNGKKKQNGKSSVWDSGSVTTRLPLPEVPFCLKKDFFRNCSPCRRAWAEAFCFGNIPRMFTPFTLRIGMN